VAVDTASTDALLNAKHSLDRVPEFSEQALFLASSIAGGSRHSPEDRASAQTGVMLIHYTRGRLGEYRRAYRRFSEMLAQDPSIEGWPYLQKLLPLVTYLHDGTEPDAAVEAAPRIAADSMMFEPFLIGAVAVQMRRADIVADQIDVLQARQNELAKTDTAWARVMEVEVRALQALSEWKIHGRARHAGEELDRLNDLAAKLPLAFWDFDYMRYETARLWLELEEPPKALRYLETYDMYDWLTTVRYEFMRGRAYEMLGDYERARMHYARFVIAWNDCDPELRPLLAQGRGALERLKGLKRL
jgi:hypothetical protein